jgi:hypothetical protein
MRSLAYSVCAALVGIPAIYGLAGTLLGLLGIQMPYPPLVTLFFGFASLVPPMFRFAVPHVALLVVGYLMLFLVLRRAWLFLAKKQRTPTSFVGFPKAMGYIGFWSFTVGILVLIQSMVLRAGSGVPAGMLMIPAMFCVPWAFFLTEILSMRQTRTGDAV